IKYTHFTYTTLFRSILIVSNEKTTSGGREVRGVEMARHPARHDIKVDIKTTVASDIGVTDAILSYVADSSATMIVMGGYGHSRLDRKSTRLNSSHEW